MIEIDSRNGGAVVRTAVGLSVATRTPVRLTNIREDRPNPGLQPQHLAGVRAAATLTDAELVGDESGSTTLTFVPNSFRLQQQIRISIATAGSVALALQPVQIGMLTAGEAVDVVVDGGATAGKWAPPIDYLQNITLSVLADHGYKHVIDVKRHGFYPEGGALVHTSLDATAIDSIEIPSRDDVVRIGGISQAATQLQDAAVADRQRDEARRVLANRFPSMDMDITAEYVEAPSPGSVITLWAETDDGRILGADAVGEKGKRSEVVGNEAANTLLDQIDAGAPVDTWLADQLIPVLAVTGGRIQIPVFTDHVEHTIRVARQISEREWTVDRDAKMVGVS